MKIAMALTVIFIVSFILIFGFIRSRNTKESPGEKSGLFMMLFLSFFFSAIITGTLGAAIMVLLGSANFINMAFSLSIGTGQLTVLALTFFVYLFVFDDAIAAVVRHFIRTRLFAGILLAIIRISVFYVSGVLTGLDRPSSLTVAAGVAGITILFEYLFSSAKKDWRKRAES